MCLCVHVDTVLLCLKHHFQFQQQEWKAMSSSDTSVLFFPNTADSKHHPKDRLKYYSTLPPSPTSHFLCCPLSPPANKKARKQK